MSNTAPTPPLSAGGIALLAESGGKEWSGEATFQVLAIIPQGSESSRCFYLRLSDGQRALYALLDQDLNDLVLYDHLRIGQALLVSSVVADNKCARLVAVQPFPGCHPCTNTPEDAIHQDLPFHSKEPGSTSPFQAEPSPRRSIFANVSSSHTRWSGRSLHSPHTSAKKALWEEDNESGGLSFPSVEVDAPTIVEEIPPETPVHPDTVHETRRRPNSPPGEGPLHPPTHPPALHFSRRPSGTSGRTRGGSQVAQSEVDKNRARVDKRPTHTRNRSDGAVALRGRGVAALRTSAGGFVPTARPSSGSAVGVGGTSMASRTTTSSTITHPPNWIEPTGKVVVMGGGTGGRFPGRRRVQATVTAAPRGRIRSKSAVDSKGRDEVDAEQEVTRPDEDEGEEEFEDEDEGERGGEEEEEEEEEEEGEDGDDEGEREEGEAGEEEEEEEEEEGEGEGEEEGRTPRLDAALVSIRRLLSAPEDEEVALGQMGTLGRLLLHRKSTHVDAVEMLIHEAKTYVDAIHTLQKYEGITRAEEGGTNVVECIELFLAFYDATVDASVTRSVDYRDEYSQLFTPSESMKLYKYLFFMREDDEAIDRDSPKVDLPSTADAVATKNSEETADEEGTLEAFLEKVQQERFGAKGGRQSVDASSDKRHLSLRARYRGELRDRILEKLKQFAVPADSLRKLSTKEFIRTSTSIIREHAAMWFAAFVLGHLSEREKLLADLDMHKGFQADTSDLCLLLRDISDWCEIAQHQDEEMLSTATHFLQEDMRAFAAHVNRALESAAASTGGEDGESDNSAY